MGDERNGERSFVDTNIFLYVVQAHPQFGKPSREILERMDAGEKAITSLINLCRNLLVARKAQKRFDGR